MKKLMLAFAVSTVFATVSRVDAETWFNGFTDPVSGGAWTDPTPEGVSFESNVYKLSDVDSFAFTATTAKALSGEVKLNFTTTVQFQDAYDVLPTVGQNDKAGVIVYDEGEKTNYWVLAKDPNGTANVWTDSGIAASRLAADITVSVVVTNGTDGAHALYTIGESTIDKLVAASESWSTVDYSGNGVVASLVGTTEAVDSAGYPIPGGKTIPADTAEAWAAANEIAKADLAEVLASTQTYTGNRTAAESCLLGVATNADLKAEIADTAADKLDFTVKCMPIAGRVQFALVKDGVEGEKQSGLKFEPAIADGIYQVVAYVDGADKQIHVSQKIGVRGTAVAASKVYFVGAPWADCSIADLFKKTCCAEGDQVEVYDAATGKYKAWKLTEGAWVFADGQGDEPTLIKKGQAVKYTAAAGTATEAKLYTVGDVSMETVTEIESGKWNLIAYPDGELAASALPLDDTADEVIVLGDDGVTATGVYIKSGNDVYTKAGYNGVWSPASGNVSGGFFFKTASAEAVTWPEKK